MNKTHIILTIAVVLSWITSAQNHNKNTLSKNDREIVLKQLKEIREKYRENIEIGKKHVEIPLETRIIFNHSLYKSDTLIPQNTTLNIDDLIFSELLTSVKTVVKRYGYPNQSRLNINEDIILEILSNPPKNIDITEYVNDVSHFLLMEVKKRNMGNIDYANLIDFLNIYYLNKKSVYGNFNNTPLNKRQLSAFNLKRKEINLNPITL